MLVLHGFFCCRLQPRTSAQNFIKEIKGVKELHRPSLAMNFTSIWHIPCSTWLLAPTKCCACPPIHTGSCSTSLQIPADSRRELLKPVPHPKSGRFGQYASHRRSGHLWLRRRWASISLTTTGTATTVSISPFRSYVDVYHTPPSFFRAPSPTSCREPVAGHLSMTGFSGYLGIVLRWGGGEVFRYVYVHVCIVFLSK